MKLYKPLKLLMLFSIAVSSFFACKKDSPVPFTDSGLPIVSNLKLSQNLCLRQDSVEITLKATDEIGLKSIKIEYSPWNINRTIEINGLLKTYNYKFKFAIPNNAEFREHSLPLTVTDMGNNNVVSNLKIRVLSEPVYTSMFVYGDVSLAGSLQQGWNYSYADPMILQNDGNLSIEVYNHKVNGEFLFISARTATAFTLGTPSNGNVAKTSAVKMVIPAIGYHRIVLNPILMTYTVSSISMPTPPSNNLWIVGDGLVEFNGFEWDPGKAIPMIVDANNPNIFTKLVTRNTADGSATKLLNATNWGGEIGWTSILDATNVGDNDFSLTRSNRKFVWIGNNENQQFTFKVDLYLNKGIVIKK